MVDAAKKGRLIVYLYATGNPVLGSDASGLANFVVTAGGSAVAIAAGGDANTGVGYNLETGNVTGYTTSGAGAGLDSGFAGLAIGGGVTLSYVSGDSANVGGVFNNSGLSLPVTWPIGVSVYRDSDGNLQGFGLSIGPGIGYANTRTDTQMYRFIDHHRDDLDRWRRASQCLLHDPYMHG